MLEAPKIVPLNVQTGLFVAIAGPSGVGKGTVVDIFKEKFKEAVFVLSHTTRAKRDGEVDGDQYHFVSKEEFEKGITEGKFLEWAQVHQKDYYGVLREPVEKALKDGKIIIRELDVQGVRQAKQTIADGALLTVFIKPEDISNLRTHIEQRGEIPPEEMERRLASAQEELKQTGEYDYVVTNYEGRVLQCYLEIESIIKSKAKARGVILSEEKSY